MEEQKLFNLIGRDEPWTCSQDGTVVDANNAAGEGRGCPVCVARHGRREALTELVDSLVENPSLAMQLWGPLNDARMAYWRRRAQETR